MTYILSDVVSITHMAAQEPGDPVSVALAFAPAPVHLLVSRHAIARSPGLVARLDEALLRARAKPSWAQALARYPGA